MRQWQSLKNCARAAAAISYLAIEGLSVDIQIVGQRHADARTAGIARWLFETVKPVSVAKFTAIEFQFAMPSRRICFAVLGASFHAALRHLPPEIEAGAPGLDRSG
jgi:hypothetical protein